MRRQLVAQSSCWESVVGHVRILGQVCELWLMESVVGRDHGEQGAVLEAVVGAAISQSALVAQDALQ